MDVLIGKCTAEPEALFILENMWLTPFDTRCSCLDPTIERVLRSLEHITIYIPRKHLRFVSENIPDKTLKEVLRLGYLMLFEIPEKRRTPEICMIAVRQRGDNLREIPSNLITPEMCMIAVRQTGWALSFVPEGLKTAEICLAAVQQNGLAIRFVPENLRSHHICMAAVQQNGLALSDVPDKGKT
jgi:hypothetical protein